MISRDQPGRPPWRVTTHAYNYEVQNGSGEGVVSYHWHPKGKVKGPHIHLGHTQLAKDVVLHNKLHIPTARLSLEGVIRHCIEELQVESLCDDWDRVLATRQADFETFRKWVSHRRRHRQPCRSRTRRTSRGGQASGGVSEPQSAPHSITTAFASSALPCL